jgi:8-oxo-dGTP pyrophosphatase MutT (NUDIX family)
MSPHRLTTESISRLLQDEGDSRLQDPFPQGFFASRPHPAAVLIPLFRHAEEWHILFIRRAENEKDRHSGQVAFPGGRVDPEDEDEVSAALRETHEEIGIPPNRVSVLGELTDYRTVSNYLVRPVVAEIPWPTDLKPDPTEVSRIFSIPLNWLARPENCLERERHLEGFDVSLPVYYFQRYDRELLWGITAKITVELLNSLGLRRPG